MASSVQAVERDRTLEAWNEAQDLDSSPRASGFHAAFERAQGTLPPWYPSPARSR